MQAQSCDGLVAFQKIKGFGPVYLPDDLGIDSVDFVDIPGRGRCRVYLARYSYDPFKQSPNENPELELSLSAGEYVLIFGEIDDDGFYNGELLDGQRGLVPSNFIDKLTGETDTRENHESLTD